MPVFLLNAVIETIKYIISGGRKSMQKIHVKANRHWMNDPNGFIYYKGKYHLFYQCFPYEARWGRMHWAHVVSDDLVNWEYQGIAVFPSKTDDRDGCFSGSAVEDEGKLYLYYTGVRYLVENPEDINLFLDEQFVSAQMLITSEDGYHFDNIKDKKTIIPVFNNSEIGDARHTRDPKVWKEDDGWYMVLGSTINNKQGKLLFFKSTDKKNWTYMNFVTKDNGFGWMWECPDYFQTDGEQILIFSPMDFNKGGKSYSDQSICMKVMFQKETCHMEMPDTYQYLDYGLDLYAPQTTVDEAGRRVLLAWLRMPKPVDGQWSGMQCIPRVIEVKNDHIYFRVHPNIRNAFSKKINSPDEADENGYRVSFSLEDGETVDIGGYQITRKGNKIHTDRGRLVDTSWEMQTEFSTPDLKDGFQIDVYVDPDLIEVFVNDGEYIISNCVYNLGTDIHQQGNVKYEMYTLEGTEVSEV